MAEPALSVVIPTYGRPGELRSCLEGFCAQTTSEPFEIVLVDDGSPQPLDDLVAAFRNDLDLRLERRPHGGAARARNVGVVLARAPLLVLFDDDQRPLPHLVDRCLSFHREVPDEGAFRLLRIGPEPGAPRDARSVAMFEGQVMFVYPSAGEQLRHAGFWGGAVTCKASIFRYGLYDPAYPMVEDVELGLRIASWLPLDCRYDGVPDAVQLRTPSVVAMARRWLRMSHCHLMWQRNYPTLVDIGTWPVYRDAEAIASGAGQIAERLAVLEAEADALGRFDPAALDPATSTRLEDFLFDLRAVVRVCQATGWLSARRDEPIESMVARVLP